MHACMYVRYVCMMPLISPENDLTCSAGGKWKANIDPKLEACN